MDEEKNQGQEVKSALQKGEKKLEQQAKKQVFKKVIAPILLVLAKYVIIGLLIYVAIASIKNFLDGQDSEESREASNSAVVYGTEIKVNRVNVDMKNIQSNGAYKLVYQFTDEKGNKLSESEAINKIKEDLQKANEDIELKDFTDSELKIIGSLMYNGLDTSRYSEEHLKALAMFVKADIAGYSFDLRDKKKDVKLEDMRDKDEVYGTLELYRTTATNDENGEAIYKEIKLEYMPYDEFQNLIEKTNKEAQEKTEKKDIDDFDELQKTMEKIGSEVLKKFSIDNDGNIVIAKSSFRSVRYKYKDRNGGILSALDFLKIDEKYIQEDEAEYVIKEHILTIDYKQYIKKYVASYGLLSDLLLITNNADFCLELAELGMNSKIALNIREEQVDTDTHHVTDYTKTSLFYDFVKYQLSGYNLTDIYRTEIVDDEPVKVYERTEKTFIRGASNADADGDLIKNAQVSENYEDYSINESYTRNEIFEFTIDMEAKSRNYRYDIDISEIDCWYLLYKRPYNNPEKEIKIYEPPEDVYGQYPQVTTGVDGVSSEALAAAEAYVEEKRKNLYGGQVNSVEGGVISVRTEEKSKTDEIVADFDSKRTLYKFGDETNIDTTQVQFKNMEYANGKPSYTPSGKKGFLFIYDEYLQKGINLCLHNDAERKLFEMLEADADTAYTSDILRFLLYVYDGIDRGIVDLDKTFKIIETTVTTFYEIESSAFGINMDRNKFISKAQGYGGSVLSQLAPQFYDICSKYNINPCFVYGWAAVESEFGNKTIKTKNLFQMGSDNGEETAETYATYEDSIEEFCKYIINCADPSSFNYSGNLERAKQYVTVNEKFDGAPDKSVYVLFCRYAWVGNTHTEDTRERISKAYSFLGGGGGCSHGTSEETSLKEKADYMQYVIDLRIKVAEDIFGQNIFLRTEDGYVNIGGSDGTGGSGDSFTAGGNESSDKYYGGKEAQAGTYISESKRKYVEWIQGYGKIGQKPLFDAGLTMGTAGCRSIWVCYIGKLYRN